MIEQIDSAESADLALLVSGPQFITAFRRMQFVAAIQDGRSNPSSIFKYETQAAYALVNLMGEAERKGWDISRIAVDILKAGPLLNRNAPEV
jgi:hypothetical protein